MKQMAIMVPARGGSKRVNNKNLRLLSGKPLIGYVFETLLGFDSPVYINTESDNILELSKEYTGIIPYRRPDHLASDTATNDDFMYDFLRSFPQYEYIIQVLPTSPFITIEEIASFRDRLIADDLDTLVSVKKQQIGCVYQGSPLNFSKTEKNPPSQEMTPVLVYATSLMGWRASTFIDNYERLGCAYHGGDGKTAYFPLKGFSTVDIDNEEDFQLAETIAQFIPFKERYRAFYWEPSYTDYIVPDIMADDGVNGTSLGKENQPVTSLPELMATMPNDESWYKTLINTENNSCTIVNQMPGEGNRRHFHAKWNEWWYILRGQWRFEIEEKNYIVKSGDLVFIEKGNKHCITAIGESIASRLAISRYDVEHIYRSRPTR